MVQFTIAILEVSIRWNFSPSRRAGGQQQQPFRTSTYKTSFIRLFLFLEKNKRNGNERTMATTHIDDEPWNQGKRRLPQVVDYIAYEASYFAFAAIHKSDTTTAEGYQDVDMRTIASSWRAGPTTG